MLTYTFIAGQRSRPSVILETTQPGKEYIIITRSYKEKRAYNEQKPKPQTGYRSALMTASRKMDIDVL